MLRTLWGCLGKIVKWTRLRLALDNCLKVWDNWRLTYGAPFDQLDAGPANVVPVGVPSDIVDLIAAADPSPAVADHPAAVAGPSGASATDAVATHEDNCLKYLISNKLSLVFAVSMADLFGFRCCEFSLAEHLLCSNSYSKIRHLVMLVIEVLGFISNASQVIRPMN